MLKGYVLTLGLFMDSESKEFSFCLNQCRTWRLRLHWLNLVDLRQTKRDFFFFFFYTCIYIAHKDNKSNLDYSCETGMVYPPEGLFYIEMDQAPPGKLGVKASHCLICGGSGNVLFPFFCFLLFAGIISGDVSDKADIWQLQCRCR